MNILQRINRRLNWEWHKWSDKVYRHFVSAPYVMSYEECVDFVLTRKASVARFGDGELNAIYNKTLGFQKADECLGRRLRDVLESDEENLLVCIPDVFYHLERYNQVEKDFWEAHNYFNRRCWYKCLKKKKMYGNAFLSRFYAMEFDKRLASVRVELLKKIWNDRDVVLVEGKYTKMGVGNDLFDNAKSIRRVLCPSTDAFAEYDKIVSGVLDLPRNENDIFILALGPTATVMAADLHKHGLQALDMGHMDIEYEWYQMGVTKKVPITGKFSNEAQILGLAKDAVTGEQKSMDYDSQIILDLSE